MMLPTAHDALVSDPDVLPKDKGGNCPCGSCGQYVRPFRLVDVRSHLFAAVKAFGFICDGCTARVINPGKGSEFRHVPVSAFLRGFPGETANQTARITRAAAKSRPEIEKLV